MRGGSGGAVGVATLTAVALTLALAPPAAAEDPPGVPVSDEAPVELDGKSPQLRMRDGATLDAPRVIDIVQVVEDEAGEERREDSNAKTKFTLQAEVLFGRDSAELNSQANARIAEIAQEIDEQGSTEVNVYGFTDDLGSYEHGVTLSQERAEAVHAQMTKSLDDSGITFNIRGYSEDYPVASNATEDGRKKNRRVEVSFPRMNE
ncbi:OmpA family protein [Streptomyces sp. TRM 70351]|uniref:OmpA family protein n=1 Tax=Streptomyces sp. TRM 70351 TaxID=3116552 RepID=UPI002E7BBF88|nr:OmpA family protein [Streptomyces sp. TRM 70351]MEE1927800.1 OmpA family protein [Streptomyces sp. TRM 70351]